MFSEIPDSILKRMKYLENNDKKDREDGTERLKRLRQIPPETGKFIALLAANCPKGECLEIGTSGGYSALWLSLAMKERNSQLITYEILPEKVAIARETFAIPEVSPWVKLVDADFLAAPDTAASIAFCFIDCEKHLYEACFDRVAPKMVSGGMIVADNAINHYEHLKGMMNKAENDPRFDCLTVPICKGEFVCRRK
ncbi:MAG: class I SAM-dependent methyltransferase [Fibrobacteres bacterium]|nr:class I SAM-dependent methyltransferase [Fibrobacterota bacterium]